MIDFEERKTFESVNMITK